MIWKLKVNFLELDSTLLLDLVPWMIQKCEMPILHLHLLATVLFRKFSLILYCSNFYSFERQGEGSNSFKSKKTRGIFKP